MIPPKDLTKLKYRYEVRGWGYFPTDMLRYDRAIVVDQEQIDEFHGRPIYKYVIMGETPPTKGRWESFMFYIVGKVTKIQAVNQIGA
jgi:hypothetical protein